MASDSRSVRTLGDLLRRQHGPDRILARARAHLRLQRQLAGRLPENLRAHAKVACVREGELVMAAESPAWATRLKMHGNEILAAARGAWPEEIKKLKVIVTVSEP